MEENKNQQMVGITSKEPETLEPLLEEKLEIASHNDGDLKDSLEEDENEIGEQTDDDEEESPVFSIDFKISVDELYQFQIDMGKEQIEKNRKRSRIISVVEIVMGIIYLGGILFSKIPNGAIQYVLGFSLIGLGLYGMVYYKYMFYPSLRKTVAKQHKKVAYFQSENSIDFYNNKCVENACGKSTPNHWRNMLGVIESGEAYYLQLEKNRCLLVPKRCAKAELEPFLREMCERFEKKWVQA